MRVVVRADASSVVGIGHLMRCLALTQALRDGDDEVVLLTSADPGPLAQGWSREGATIRHVNAEAGSTADAALTAEVVRELAAAWLVLDGYAFGAKYRSELESGAHHVIIDDHGAAGLRADLVVNGNLYGHDGLYPDVRGRLLTGPRYAMLRRDFRSTPRRGGEGTVLSLGGADRDARTAMLVEALTKRGIRGRVVIGPRYRSPQAVRAKAIESGWEVVDAPEEMARLLGSAEMAVVGAGTTALECVALGVPMVAVLMADNQAAVSTALDDLGLAAVADGADPEHVSDLAAALASDPTRRAAMTNIGPRLVDGRGALRVAGAMREVLMTLRPATRKDARLLFAWRNDPGTRAASFSTEKVPWERHVAWLDRVIGSPDTIHRIAMLDGREVGVLRLERRGRAATISINVAPDSRSRGLAAPLIRAGLAAASWVGIRQLDALIRSENIASRRAFGAAGFVDSPPREEYPIPAGAVHMIASVQRRR